MAFYRVIFTRSAEKDLRKVETPAISKILEKVESLSENPRPPGSRKLVGSEKSYRIRIGYYRVVYSIADQVKVVEIGRIRHRKDVYR